MSRDYTEITDEQLRAINKRAIEQPSYEQLREQNRVLREALKPFAERWEYFERTKHPSGGKWPEDLEYADDDPSAIYLGQLKAAKAALTATNQEGQHGSR